jgi:membrane protease YdiL (CAAX protease family)
MSISLDTLYRPRYFFNKEEHASHYLSRCADFFVTNYKEKSHYNSFFKGPYRNNEYLCDRPSNISKKFWEVIKTPYSRLYNYTKHFNEMLRLSIFRITSLPLILTHKFCDTYYCSESRKNFYKCLPSILSIIGICFYSLTFLKFGLVISLLHRFIANYCGLNHLYGYSFDEVMHKTTNLQHNNAKADDVFATTINAPVLEEMAFRGFMLPFFVCTITLFLPHLIFASKVISVIATAIIFGAVHMTNAVFYGEAFTLQQCIHASIGGVIAGQQYYQSGLIGSIGAHMVYNASIYFIPFACNAYKNSFYLAKKHIFSIS